MIRDDIFMNQYLSYFFPNPRKGFALIGDTQRTMGYQILMGREANNDVERRTLVGEIAALEPDFVSILGDLVCWGQREKDWVYFDDVMRTLKEKRIPLVPVIGNHDYFIFRKKAESYLRDRFRELAQRTWWFKRWGKLALIILDSNKGPLGEKLWQDQLMWLAKTMQDCERDDSIKGILFLSHHPPFTNSMEIGPHKPTRECFLPHFYASKKTMIYFSGHCHAYERFNEKGKTFIVSGGGGGPRQPLRIGRFKRSEDLFGKTRFRPFHYIWCEHQDDGLKLTVRGIEKKEPQTRVMEEIFYPWND